MKPIRVVIADDETVARRILRKFSWQMGGLEVVGESSSGPETVELVQRARPQLLFLDVGMPGGSGIEALRSIRQGESPPWVVFTTAHQEHTLEAFELRAIDYLLKPFGWKRFAEAVDRARTLILRGISFRRLGPLVYSDQDLDRLFVRQNGRILVLPPEEIVYFEASGDVVTLRQQDRSYVVFVPLKDLETRLDDRFVRVRRSHLVNLHHVECFERHDRRRLAVVLRDGTRIVASRNRSRELRELAL